MAGPNSVFRLAFVNAIEAQQCPDEELVRRLAEGQREALDPLHERYGPVLTNLAARQLDRPAAEEIVQDVFLTVWQHAGRFDPQRGSFRPWVFQITRRRIINELRRRRSRPQVEADPEGVLLDGLQDDAPEVADKLASDERRSAVRGALEVLPQPQREAVALAFLDELTHEEVASALRVPLGTTKTRIRTGLLKLRVELMTLGVAALLAGLSGGLALRSFDAQLGYDRDERALALVTASDLVPLRLTPAPAAELPAEVHGHYRSRPGTDIAVLTVSSLPPSPAGAVYQAWVSTAGQWTSLGILHLDETGGARLISEGPVLAAAPDVVRVTVEPAAGHPTPSGPTVLTWSSTP
jgi:RNA polymerase sigma factor (sigma-70 family)